jgi:hypothetical protein
VYRLPGLSRRAAAVVVERVEEAYADGDRPTGRTRELSVLDALKMALCRLRTNATYAALGADFGVSTSVAWDYVHDRVGGLADLLGQDPEELAQSVRGTVVLADGTLVPVVNWRPRRDLYSPRHRRCGVNLQVLVDLPGRLVGVSRWCPGRRHDLCCCTHAGLNTLLGAAGGMIGDTAYQGSGMVTPVRTPPGRQLPDAVRESNRKICKVRAAAEPGVAHRKNWWVRSTRYRSDLRRFNTEAQVVVSLQRLNERCTGRRLSFAYVRATGLAA